MGLTHYRCRSLLRWVWQVRVLQNLLGDGRDACTAFDHLYFFGDLNYRVGAAHLPNKVSPASTEGQQEFERVIADVKAKRWTALYERDQLRAQIASGKAFFGFHDGGPPPYPPTFKYSSDERKGEYVEGVPQRYRRVRIPSYCDRVLSLHGPAAKSTRRLQQGCATEMCPHSDHAPVWCTFESAYLPHAPMPAELDFEDTWHLEVRSLAVRVAIGKLRDPEGGWLGMYGERWLGAKPPLHASVGANFLSRSSERLAAPRPPGTMVQGRGRELELLARWDAAELALSPLASQLGLEWLRADPIVITIHGGDATPHVPLGSARFNTSDACTPPAALNPGSGAAFSRGGPGSFAGFGGGMYAPAPTTVEVQAEAPLVWCGVHCGEVKLTYAIRLADSSAADYLYRDASTEAGSAASTPYAPGGCATGGDAREGGAGSDACVSGSDGRGSCSGRSSTKSGGSSARSSAKRVGADGLPTERSTDSTRRTSLRSIVAGLAQRRSSGQASHAVSSGRATSATSGRPTSIVSGRATSVASGRATPTGGPGGEGGAAGCALQSIASVSARLTEGHEEESIKEPSSPETGSAPCTPTPQSPACTHDACSSGARHSARTSSLPVSGRQTRLEAHAAAIAAGSAHRSRSSDYEVRRRSSMLTGRRSSATNLYTRWSQGLRGPFARRTSTDHLDRPGSPASVQAPSGAVTCTMPLSAQSAAVAVANLGATASHGEVGGPLEHLRRTESSSLFGSPSCACEYGVARDTSADAFGAYTGGALSFDQHGAHPPVTSLLGLGYGASNSRDAVWRRSQEERQPFLPRGDRPAGAHSQPPGGWGAVVAGGASDADNDGSVPCSHPSGPLNSLSDGRVVRTTQDGSDAHHDDECNEAFESSDETGSEDTDGGVECEGPSPRPTTSSLPVHPASASQRQAHQAVASNEDLIDLSSLRLASVPAPRPPQ